MNTSSQYKIAIKFDKEIVTQEIDKTITIKDLYQILKDRFFFSPEALDKIDILYLNGNTLSVIKNDESLETFLEGNHRTLVLQRKHKMPSFAPEPELHFQGDKEFLSLESMTQGKSLNKNTPNRIKFQNNQKVEEDNLNTNQYIEKKNEEERMSLQMKRKQEKKDQTKNYNELMNNGIELYHRDVKGENDSNYIDRNHIIIETVNNEKLNKTLTLLQDLVVQINNNSNEFYSYQRKENSEIKESLSRSTRLTSNTLEKYNHEIECKQCLQLIIGIRYKCNFCAEYDICEDCYSQNKTSNFHLHNTFLLIENSSIYTYEKQNYIKNTIQKETINSFFILPLEDEQQKKLIENSNSFINNNTRDISDENFHKFKNDLVDQNLTTLINIWNDDQIPKFKGFTNNKVYKNIETLDKSQNKIDEDPDVNTIASISRHFIELNNGQYIYEVNIQRDESTKTIEINYKTDLKEISVVYLRKYSSIAASQININSKDKIITFLFTQIKRFNPSYNKLEFYFEVESKPKDLCQKTKEFKICFIRPK